MSLCIHSTTSSAFLYHATPHHHRVAAYRPASAIKPVYPVVVPLYKSGASLKFRPGDDEEDEETKKAMLEKNLLEQFEKQIEGPEPPISYIMRDEQGRPTKVSYIIK